MAVLKFKRRKESVQPPKGDGALRDLANAYYGLEAAQLDVKRKYSEAFRELEQLETDKEELKLKIQTIARRKAIQGQTVSLIKEPWIDVYVCGNQASQRYDLTKAMKHWPEDILMAVLEVNGAKVQELVNSEELDEKVAMKAALPREARTPAVNIRVNTDYDQAGSSRRTKRSHG